MALFASSGAQSPVYDPKLSPLMPNLPRALIVAGRHYGKKLHAIRGGAVGRIMTFRRGLVHVLSPSAL